MTCQAVMAGFSGSGFGGARAPVGGEVAHVMRRPPGPGRQPVTAAMVGGNAGSLPRFLCTAAAPGRRMPARRGADGNAEAVSGAVWTDWDAPLKIGAFDSRNDVLSLLIEPGDPLPELAVERDQERGVTRLLANGKPMAVIDDARGEFSLRNVALTRYAA